jgi:(hydroxyamino)benzene mutase
MNRPLMQLGFILILLGFLTGLAIPFFPNPRMGVTAHNVGIIGGLVLVVVGAVAGSFRFSRRSAAAFTGSWIYATYANWLGCVVAAATGASRLTPVAGAGFTGSPIAEGVVAFIFLTEGVAALAAAGLALWGLRRLPDAAFPPPRRTESVPEKAPAIPESWSL